MNLNWFINRLKTMSIPEVMYRVNQLRKRKADKKYMGAFFELPDKPVSFNNYLPQISISKIEDINLANTISVFGKKYSIDGKIDWHLDLMSKKIFENNYCFEMTPRTHGEKCVKHTWEINRFHFLPNWALYYKKTGNKEILERIFSCIEDWIDENPYLVGVNWYTGLEVSVRLLNWWIVWNILELGEESDIGERNFNNEKWLPVIYSHLHYLDRYLSKYSSANNHLTGEIAGLYIGAKCWNFKESEVWAKKAKRLLHEEIVLQHTQGVNKEEASEYIQFITDFFLLAYWIGEKSGDNFSMEYVSILEEIAEYIDVITHRDGETFFYGDADDGFVFKIEPEESNFLNILNAVNIVLKKPHLKRAKAPFSLKNHILFGEQREKILDSSDAKESKEIKLYSYAKHFYIKNESIFAHFNIGSLGYLTTAAHGHADCLAFELKLNNKWFLIDPGTYSYHKEPKYRNYFKSTLAHNTISVNGKDQAINAAPMIWLDHYDSKVIEHSETNEALIIVGAHNGYEKEGVSLKRSITWYKKVNKIIIEDSLTNQDKKDKNIKIHFHFNPELEISRSGNKWILQSLSGEELTMNLDSRFESNNFFGSQNPILGWQSTEFYKKQPCHTIVGELNADGDISFKTELMFKI